MLVGCHGNIFNCTPVEVVVDGQHNERLLLRLVISFKCSQQQKYVGGLTAQKVNSAKDFTPAFIPEGFFSLFSYSCETDPLFSKTTYFSWMTSQASITHPITDLVRFNRPIHVCTVIKRRLYKKNICPWNKSTHGLVAPSLLALE